MPRRKTARNKSIMDAALDYITSRPRTVREVENKLDSLDYGEGDVEIVIARLKELGLLDDVKYASDFVATRLSTKPLSRRKLREQLYTHKLPKDIINEAIGSVDDAAEAANARAVAEKYARQFAALDAQERKLRVMRRLVGRGFEYNASRAALESLFGDAEGLESCTEDEREED